MGSVDNLFTLFFTKVGSTEPPFVSRPLLIHCAPARTRTWDDCSEDSNDIHFTTGACVCSIIRNSSSFCNEKARCLRNGPLLFCGNAATHLVSVGNRISLGRFVINVIRSSISKVGSSRSYANLGRNFFATASTSISMAPKRNQHMRASAIKSP